MQAAIGLALTASLCVPVPSAALQPEAEAPMRAADEWTPIHDVRVQGLDAWGVDGADPSRVRVRFLPTPDGLIAAEQDDPDAPLMTVGEALGDEGAVLDQSALRAIGEGVVGWLLREHGVDYAPQGVPEVELVGRTAVYTLDPPGPGQGETGPFTVSRVELRGLTGLGLSEEEIRDADVEFTPVEGGLIARRSGLPYVEIPIGRIAQDDRRLYGSALQQVGRRIVELYNARGLRGVRVQGRTPTSDGVFALEVTEGVVGDIRTIVTVEGGEPRRDPRSHLRLERGSPVQAGDLVDIEALDRYVQFLGRRPGRRVDLALAPGEAADEVALDLLVAENDPLLLYAQISNTGTESTTRVRERVGLIHYNLTNVDDVLQLDFLTGNLDEVNAFTGSYERPFTDLSRWSWRVFGSAYEYTADEIGFPGDAFEGENYSLGGEARWNFHQSGPFFADLVAGARWERNRVVNQVADITGSTDFFLPYAGLRIEEQTDRSTLRAYLGLERNLPGVADTDDTEIDQLGRFDVDDDFAVLRADVTQSFYLEPLLVPGWEDLENPTLAHELMLSFKGVHSLGNRLPPTFGATAGGFFTVRGYPEAFAFGDKAAIATAEYRFHVPRALPPADPGELFGDPFRFRPQQPLARPDWDLVLRAFLDVAYLENEGRLSFEEDRTLVGTGVGVELSVLRNLNVRVDWGIALQDEETSSDDVDAGDSRIHVLATLFF